MKSPRDKMLDAHISKAIKALGIGKAALNISVAAASAALNADPSRSGRARSLRVLYLDGYMAGVSHSLRITRKAFKGG
jgi:hypothetical protein